MRVADADAIKKRKENTKDYRRLIIFNDFILGLLFKRYIHEFVIFTKQEHLEK